jgi:hypothetical protein
MKVAGYLVTFLVGGLICWLLFSLGAIDKIGAIPIEQKGPDQNVSVYLSFLSVMLTGISVLLAALAIVIGIVAAYTFKELGERVEISVKKQLKETFSNPEIDRIIISRVDEIVFRINKKSISLGELEENFDPSNKEER